MDKITIYGLHRPGRDIFYVGKSKDPARRMREHRKRYDREVEMITLEVVDVAGWRAAEHAWIQEFRDSGLTMANRTEGGDGIEVMSAEQRAEISRQQTGRKHTPEARAKMSAKLKGKRKTWTLDGLERAAATRFRPAIISGPRFLRRRRSNTNSACAISIRHSHMRRDLRVPQNVWKSL